MPDLWTDTDGPLLRTIVTLFDATPTVGVRTAQAKELSGLEDAEFEAAMIRLETAEPPLLSGIPKWDLNYVFQITSVTERARVKVGDWPSPESLIDGLIAALAEAAEAEPDPVKKTKLKQAVEVISGFGLQVAIGWATKSVPPLH
jgi:hypothetical protein